MKFLYQYKTSRNELRDGVIYAGSRDAVYADLKKQGIRPSRVSLAPGVWNHIQSIGKRWFAIIFLAFAIIGLVTYMVFWRSLVVAEQTSASPRHQIYGDPAILEDVFSSDFASVFPSPGHRILARYAIPGRDVVSVRSSATNATVLADCVNVRIEVSPDDPREVRELKQIVKGMQSELREYLTVGTGTAATYIRRLNERQLEERRIVERVRQELEANLDRGFWEDRNKALRELGLRTFSRPKNN